MKAQFEMKIGKETIKCEEKSHAANFRKFWSHFMEKDLKKTVETIDLVGIRTSDSELFIAKNGSKKKNIPLTEDRWIYTHLTPAAMHKAYEKFAKGWEGKWEQKTDAKDAPAKAKAPKKPEMTEEEYLESDEAAAAAEAENADFDKKIEKQAKKELTPQQKAAETRKKNAEKKAKEKAEKQAKKATAGKKADTTKKDETPKTETKPQEQLTTEEISEVKI